MHSCALCKTLWICFCVWKERHILPGCYKTNRKHFWLMLSQWFPHRCAEIAQLLSKDPLRHTSLVWLYAGYIFFFFPFCVCEKHRVSFLSVKTPSWCNIHVLFFSGSHTVKNHLYLAIAVWWSEIIKGVGSSVSTLVLEQDAESITAAGMLSCSWLCAASALWNGKKLTFYNRGQYCFTSFVFSLHPAKTLSMLAYHSVTEKWAGWFLNLKVLTVARTSGSALPAPESQCLWPRPHIH